jgi:hypothetical protein
MVFLFAAEGGNVSLPEFFEHGICESCGGQCCKNGSCLAAPSDFGNEYSEVVSNLRLALESGMWIVDWWEDNCPGLPSGKTGYFIRPRQVCDHDDAWFCPSWGSRCLFLEEGGCALPDEARPLGAKTLEPKSNGSCIQHANGKLGNDKITFARLWYPYYQAILALKEA